MIEKPTVAALAEFLLRAEWDERRIHDYLDGRGDVTRLDARLAACDLRSSVESLVRLCDAEAA